MHPIWQYLLRHGNLTRSCRLVGKNVISRVEESGSKAPFHHCAIWKPTDHAVPLLVCKNRKQHASHKCEAGTVMHVHSVQLSKIGGGPRAPTAHIPGKGCADALEVGDFTCRPTEL